MVTEAASIETRSASDSAWRVRLRRAGELTASLLKNPTTVVGLVLIVLMISMALFAPWLIEPNTPDPYQMPRDWGAIAVPPGTPGHPLGTTNVGGDVLYGVIWGARTSLRLSVLVVDGRPQSGQLGDETIDAVEDVSVVGHDDVGPHGRRTRRDTRAVEETLAGEFRFFPVAGVH